MASATTRSRTRVPTTSRPAPTCCCRRCLPGPAWPPDPLLNGLELERRRRHGAGVGITAPLGNGEERLVTCCIGGRDRHEKAIAGRNAYIGGGSHRACRV